MGLAQALGMRRLAPALVAAALLAAAAPGRPARAAGGQGTLLLGNIVLLGAIGATSLLGTATDVGLGVSLGTTGRAPLLLGLGGTVLWVATSALYVTLLAVDGASGQALLNPGTIIAGLFCAGSLGLSIYGLTRAPPGISLVPAAIRGPHGDLAPGAALSLHW